jgi:hypothetical protein
MSANQAERIRVILRKVRINDNLEPFFDSEGEFRFKVRVSSRNDGGIEQETVLPSEGYYSISDHPTWNQQHIDKVVFEGEVTDHLQIEIEGEELDFYKTDKLPTYRRVFEGSPASWIGVYRPGDEGENDPERMDAWWVYLEIEKA